MPGIGRYARRKQRQKTCRDKTLLIDQLPALQLARFSRKSSGCAIAAKATRLLHRHLNQKRKKQQARELQEQNNSPEKRLKTAPEPPIQEYTLADLEVWEQDIEERIQCREEKDIPCPYTTGNRSRTAEEKMTTAGSIPPPNLVPGSVSIVRTPYKVTRLIIGYVNCVSTSLLPVSHFIFCD